ncbi:MAG: HEAT repeat domain-containing protein [Planctomycetota bacterium]|jgi:hypothetical protein|nr:HEAT repeat domain-containing protein [Planctomycetota bacterium]MDP7248786.1 HEAT repeat domain-containing protein [Planctomycetota bacterium]
MKLPNLLLPIFVLASAVSLHAESNGPVPQPTVFDQFRKKPTAAIALRLAREGLSDPSDLRMGLMLPEKATRLLAWALHRYPNPALRKELESMLRSPDQVAGYWAAMALGRIGDSASIPALAAQLPDKADGFWEVSRGGPDRRERTLYFKYVWNKKQKKNVRRPTDAPPEMPNVRVAYASVEALGQIGDEEALEILMREAKRDHYLIRYGAARALGRMRHQPAKKVLKTMSEKDPVLVVRAAAKESLQKLAGAGSRASAPRGLPSSIIFIKTEERTESNLGFRDSYPYPKTPWYAHGQNLYSLTPPQPDGILRNLTNLKDGAVQGAEISWDGRKVLFAMRKHFKTDGFHIYEMNVDGSGLRQITSGNCNDVDPHYLPDGKIVFCSDRTGYREFYHQERSRVLYTVEADGSDVQQITFNPNSDFEPYVLNDGRILYASYRFYGQDGGPGAVPGDKRTGLGRIETVLRSVLPDGSGDQLFYGSMRGGFFSTLLPMPYANQFQTTAHPRTKQMVGVSVSFSRLLPDGRMVCVTPSGLTVIDTAADPTDCELPLYPEIMNLAGGEEVYIHSFDDQNPIGRFTSPYPAGGDWVFVSYAPWHDTRWNGYGLHLLNLKTRELRLVYDDPDLSDVDPIAVAPRARPPVIPPVRKPNSSNTGFVVCQSVFNSDLPFDRTKVASVRVLEAVQMGMAINANGGFETRVLASVPLAKDGSFHVEVPADTPIRFELVDLDGKTLVHETAFSYVRSGERKGCIGCHEPKARGVPNSFSDASLRPPYKALRKRGDLIYEGSKRASFNYIFRE